MVPVALSISGVSATRLLDCDAWHVVAGGTTHRLRAWRWGERRRLVRACARGRRLDQAAFVTALTALLYDPPPPPALAPLFATAALKLLGVGDGAAPAPLARSEAALAQRFGWTPGALENEPAAVLDALLGSQGPASEAPAPGWQRITVGEELSA
jgi:hypothetical protein